MKNILEIRHKERGHWVGDGFPVRTMFSYSDLGLKISPFLLLDYAGPAEFAPASKPRGVEQHPHRGFETVTILYQGEVEHRDTAGNTGKIGPGDVQWMTAARGVLHEEMHSKAFTERGGAFEAVQLWVNLPASEKMSRPRYQELAAAKIPTVDLPNQDGQIRVIAGVYKDAVGKETRGLAQTVTPVALWDIKLRAGRRLDLDMRDGDTAAILVLRGAIALGGDARDGGKSAGVGELVVFEQEGRGIGLCATGTQDAALLVMGGTPIVEPIAGYGPFVMNTQGEIRQAMLDFETGRF